MKLRPAKLAICLLLGLAISTLVAWRCAIVGERASTSEEIPRDRVEALWREVVGPIAEKNELGGRHISAAGNTWYMFGEEPEMMSDGSLRLNQILVVLRRQTGLPMRCVEGDDIIRTAAPPVYETHELRGYMRIPPVSLLTGRTTYAVPIRPLWFGLIINTICYGVAIWLIWWMIGAVCRRARFDRNRCPRCKHDLRAASRTHDTVTCSECGSKITTVLFNRPRMIFRWWMTPMLVPAIVLCALWFLGGFDWLWLRYQLRWGGNIFSLSTIILLALVAIFLFSIGLVAYHDRPQRSCRIIALCVAIVLTIVAYIPLHAIALWFAS